MRRAAFLAPAVVFVACASPAPPPRPAATATRCENAPTPAPDPHAFDALAARAASEAPLMRELQRFAIAPGSGEPARFVAERDLCVRAFYEAASSDGGPGLRFVDASGATLGGPADRGPRGAIPPQGPVCVRKGDAVRLAASDPTRARVLVLGTP